MTTMDDAPLTRREFQSFREELRQDFRHLPRGFAPGVAALRHKSGLSQI